MDMSGHYGYDLVSPILTVKGFGRSPVTRVFIGHIHRRSYYSSQSSLKWEALNLAVLSSVLSTRDDNKNQFSIDRSGI